MRGPVPTGDLISHVWPPQAGFSEAVKLRSGKPKGGFSGDFCTTKMEEGFLKMPFPNPDYSKRDYLLPDGCKDVTDLLRREAAAAIERDGDGDIPVTRWVQLPEMVSVKFLAESQDNTSTLS